MKGNLSQAQGGDAGSGARQRDPRVYRLEVEEQTQHGPGKAECDRDGGGEEAGVWGGHLTKSLRSGETTVYHPNWDPFRATFCTWGNEHGDGPGQARRMATPLTRPASRVTHSGPGEVPAEVCAED